MSERIRYEENEYGVKHFVGEINTDGYELRLTGPSREVKQLAEMLDPFSRILDLGSCYGDNSIYLAEQGHTVFSVEKNLGYLRDGEKMKTSLYNEGRLNHFAVNGDIRQLMFRGQFDAVILTRVVQMIDREDVRAVIDESMQYCRKGGLCLTVAYISTPEQQIYMPHRTFLQPGELVSMYESADWKIEHSEERLEPLHQQDDGSYTNSSFSTVIARNSQPFNVAVRKNTGADAEFWQRANPEYYDLLLEQYG